MPPTGRDAAAGGNARALHLGWDYRSESHEPVRVAHWSPRAETKKKVVGNVIY
ncbi:MAG: hypothetical protein LBQ54_14460 [Planctomycetaceae bacterium]|nr:hypothetical protein [Planctomycetaceae bacterium]